MISSTTMAQRSDELRPYLVAASPVDIGTAVIGWSQDGFTARVVRGRKMRTEAALLDEFAAALQFPIYFGENKDAFDECLAELDNLPPGKGYVVTITEPDQVLADESPGALHWLVRSLQRAAKELGQPIELGEWWDRPALPFKVVLAGSRECVAIAERRWSSAGAHLMAA